MVLHQQQQNWSFNEKTFRSIFENINQLRKNKTLCDVILKVDNEQFYAHRVILSACSDYFCAMFTSEVMQPLNFALRSVLSVVY
jgi:hypothetical protein